MRNLARLALPDAGRVRMRTFAAAAAVGFAYWALAKFSFALPVRDSGISYIWPADGIAVGALLCVPRRYWPLFLAAVFLGNFTASNKPVALNLLYSGFQVLESFFVARVLGWILGARPRLDSLRSALQIAGGILLATAGAILVSNSIDWAIHRGDFWHVYGVWYVSDTLGILVVAPLVVAVLNEWRVEWGDTGPWRRLEGAATMLAMFAATYVAFALAPGTLPEWLDFSATPLAVPALVMLWAATRFGLPGGMLTVAILLLTSFRYTAFGQGPFAIKYGDAHTALIHLQLMLALVSVLVMLVAARTVEWRRALAESQVSRKRLEFAIEASDMVVWESDPDTGQFKWSGDTSFILGIAEEGLATPAAWQERLHPEDRAHVRRQHALLQAGVRPFLTLDYRLRRDDGGYATVTADAYSVPHREGDPEAHRHMHVIGVLRNVTRARRVEAEKARLEERLRQAEKLEAIGGLAGGVAHDFNNILGAILGYAEMLQEKTDAGSKLRKYADTIAAAGGRGKSLVAKILAFSRVSDAQMHVVELRHLAEEVVATLRGSLPAEVTLNVSLPGEPVTVFGNATDLYQVAMNLCTNAVQAMPGGGELGITLAAVKVESPREVYSGVLAPGTYVSLAVEDQGVGIPDTVLPRIFEPFFTTKGRSQGTGLGLAIAHGVTLAHGGAIDVQTHTGVGTRMTVYLPPHAGETPADDPATDELPRGRGQTVLVVDDEPHLVELAQDMLAELGYEPVGFDTSGRALAAITLKPDRFDAVVSDEVMPELTGSELCARLRAQGFPRPVILVSGYGGPGFEARAKAVGATQVVRKPYRKRELALALAEALASHAAPQEAAMSAQSTATSDS